MHPIKPVYTGPTWHEDIPFEYEVLNFSSSFGNDAQFDHVQASKSLTNDLQILRCAYNASHSPYSASANQKLHSQYHESHAHTCHAVKTSHLLSTWTTASRSTLALVLGRRFSVLNRLTDVSMLIYRLQISFKVHKRTSC